MITALIPWTLPLLLFHYLYIQYTRHPNIPGPFLARFTDLHRFLSVYHRDAHNDQLALHRQHGDLVRLGPNTISVSGPDYVSQIYGIHKGLTKSDFYSVFQNIVNGKRAASLVAVTDEAEHARAKRPVAHAYSLSTLVEFEGFVDSTTEVFLAQLDARFTGAGAGASAPPPPPCDLGRWLQFYAFDVIGELTFSKRLGFIESGEDVGNIMRDIGANFDYFSLIGQMPWLDLWLGKNPVYVRYFRKPVTSPILRYAQELLRERLEKGGEEGEEERKDFLSRFLQIRKEVEEPVSDAQVLSYLFMNINAGSDTIASTLRGIFYHLLKNPSTLTKLTTELRTAAAEGSLTLPTPTWHETQGPHLSYLRGVIKEGLRINPALGLPLERVVGDHGITLSSSSQPSSSEPTFLPPGTIVGINPYVLHRDPRIFPDPDTWNPGRWVGVSDAELRNMDHHILAFGAGKRSCMGKNIAMLELMKVVPAVVARFEIELDDPRREWTVRNSWALNQSGLVVRLKRRNVWK